MYSRYTGGGQAAGPGRGERAVCVGAAGGMEHTGRCAGSRFSGIELMRRAESEGVDSLYRELENIDPASAAGMLPNNLRRIIRALEIYDQDRQISLVTSRKEGAAVPGADHRPDRRTGTALQSHRQPDRPDDCGRIRRRGEKPAGYGLP